MSESETPPELAIVAPTEGKAAEWTTALCAAGFDYRLEHGEGGWVFHVPADTADAVRAELDAYEADNRDWPPVARPDPTPACAIPLSASPLWAGGLLIVFYVWLGPFSSANPILRAAALDAEAVRAGEGWRVLTALLVHADAAHLAGNVCCLLLLGRVACGAFGSGLAWALILGAGGGGNTLEALWFPSLRLSVGASTAGFGVLGLLVGYRAVSAARHWSQARPALRAIALPTFAGLALLALLGTGPRSDLVAHALGMLSGGVFGAVLGALGVPRLPGWVHRALELLCITALMLAWGAAFRAAAH